MYPVLDDTKLGQDSSEQAPSGACSASCHDLNASTLRGPGAFPSSILRLEASPGRGQDWGDSARIESRRSEPSTAEVLRGVRHADFRRETVREQELGSDLQVPVRGDSQAIRRVRIHSKGTHHGVNAVASDPGFLAVEPGNHVAAPGGGPLPARAGVWIVETVRAYGPTQDVYTVASAAVVLDAGGDAGHSPHEARCIRPGDHQVHEQVLAQVPSGVVTRAREVEIVWIPGTADGGTFRGHGAHVKSNLGAIIRAGKNRSSAEECEY